MTDSRFSRFSNKDKSMGQAMEWVSYIVCLGDFVFFHDAYLLWLSKWDLFWSFKFPLNMLTNVTFDLNPSVYSYNV